MPLELRNSARIGLNFCETMTVLWHTVSPFFNRTAYITYSMQMYGVKNTNDLSDSN